MTTPAALLFDLFGTLVFFDDTRVPSVELEGRRVPMTVQGLPELLREVLPSVGVPAFLGELRNASAAIAERKRREDVEIPTAVRFERALVALGAAPQDAASFAGIMASRHMDTLARAVVCPPGRAALLAALSRSHRLALVSNFDDGPTARRILDEHGLAPFFEVVVISEEEGLRKPARQIFERACARLSLEPGRCLYIGDTLEDDVQGAHGAGLEVVWIRRGEPETATESPALAVLRDVDALPQWLRASRGEAVSVPRGERR